MRRWQLTAILVVLATTGVSLAAGTPVGVSVVRRGRTLLQEVWEQVVPTWHDDHRDPPPPEPPAPSPVPSSTIPELSEPLPAPVPVIRVLPPDPVPMHVGCGGAPVPIDQPVPACGRG